MSPPPAGAILNVSQRAQFARDGYVVLPGLLNATRVEALNAALSRIIERVGAEHATGQRLDSFWQQLPHSAERVEVFWMPGQPGDGAGARFPESRVARVGHILHRQDENFSQVSLRSVVALALQDLLGEGACALQSAVTYKQPRSDFVQFGFHQDAAYLTTDPPDMVLAFVALDDADAENGALMVAPGSHRLGLGEQLRLGANGYEHVRGSSPRIDRSSGVLLPMRRGDVALVHGLTYHASDPNGSVRPRRALIIHAGPARVRMAPFCWVQPPAGGFARLDPTETL